MGRNTQSMEANALPCVCFQHIEINDILNRWPLGNVNLSSKTVAFLTERGLSRQVPSQESGVRIQNKL